MFYFSWSLKTYSSNLNSINKKLSYWSCGHVFSLVCFKYLLWCWGCKTSHCVSLFRTRESLASNTSSIVESNRRQNLALSPGHLGITSGNGPPFSFRTIPEPASTQPEKLQKPSACLASITSV